MAIAAVPHLNSFRDEAICVSRTVASFWRRTSGEVMVCGVNAGSPASMTRSTTAGGEKASSALPEAAAWAGMVLCCSDSAWMRPAVRWAGGCSTRTSVPRRMPSRMSPLVARDSSSSTGRERITVRVYEQTSDSMFSLPIMRSGRAIR